MDQHFEETKDSLEIVSSKQVLLTVETNLFNEYLAQLQLPTENIIASTDERKIVSEAIPNLVGTLPIEVRRRSRYLSKFIGASAIGLFDAALNYVWNEVVLVLRNKAITYGLDLFFDAAIGGAKRDLYKTEEDLHNLKDAQLIDTCSKLELISPIVQKKIKHILDMRNEVAASHPNVEAISGYELMGWLSTCVNEIKESRSDSAIKIKSFVDNLKSYTTEIDSITSASLLEEIQGLSSPHIHNLLFTLFNWYTSIDNQILRKNISKIIKKIWDLSTDQAKYKIGERLDSFRKQLKENEREKGEEFLSIVDGRRFETINAKHIILDHLSDQLIWAHNGFDNYHTEPIYMREIMQYCHYSNDIPESIQYKLFYTILLCRLGRGWVSYQDGIGTTAKSLYDSFFEILDDRAITISLQCVWVNDIQIKLEYPQCRKHLEHVLAIFANKAVNERLKEIIAYIKANIVSIKSLASDSTFIALTNNWEHNWLHRIKKQEIS